MWFWATNISKHGQEKQVVSAKSCQYYLHMGLLNCLFITTADQYVQNNCHVLLYRQNSRHNIESLDVVNDHNTDSHDTHCAE